MNAQDVDIYVFTKEGVYLYDAGQHALAPIAAGDFRNQIGMRPGGQPRPAGQKPENQPAPKSGAPSGPPPARPPQSPAPVELVLVSDASRFGGGTPELRAEWGAIDVGIVSQNIALFCASSGLVTRPRASVNKEKLPGLLRLKPGQRPVLNHPVGYPKE